MATKLKDKGSEVDPICIKYRRDRDQKKHEKLVSLVEKLGKNYDNLSKTQKELLRRCSGKLGTEVRNLKFSKAVVEGDVKSMWAEYQSWRETLTRRIPFQELEDKSVKSLIDSIGR
jgi:hypothetical protein